MQYKQFKLMKNSKNPSKEWSLTERNFKVITDPAPNTNYGTPTGSINNITVIDIDYKDGGFKIPACYLNLHAHTVKTPNGGCHYYFKYDKELYTTQNKKYNVDIRNDGAYVVAPKSTINNKWDRDN